MKDGIQETTMTVDGSGFTPNRFYVKKNVPVRWIIKGDSINPCNNAIAIPALNKVSLFINKLLIYFLQAVKCYTLFLK